MSCMKSTRHRDDRHALYTLQWCRCDARHTYMHGTWPNVRVTYESFEESYAFKRMSSTRWCCRRWWWRWWRFSAYVNSLCLMFCHSYDSAWMGKTKQKQNRNETHIFLFGCCFVCAPSDHWMLSLSLFPFATKARVDLLTMLLSHFFSRLFYSSSSLHTRCVCVCVCQIL